MSNPSLDGKDKQWAVSLVRGDLLFRFQRKIGLIPEQGLGIARRALFWSLLAWLPIAIWAWKNGYLLPVEGDEPLLAHFGINARLLLAVPLFIIAEGMMQSTLDRFAATPRQFRRRPTRATGSPAFYSRRHRPTARFGAAVDRNLRRACLVFPPFKTQRSAA